MPTTTSTEQTALETLVIAQITELRRRESDLQKRICGFPPSFQGTDQVSFSDELWQLQQRTDRLGRMMDAMGGYSTRQFV